MRAIALAALMMGAWLFAAATPPHAAAATASASQAAGGVYQTCARTTSGAAKCWGANFDGQLGDGTQVNSPTAVDVAGLGSDVASVAGGYAHMCAVTTSGGARCWGYNISGQVGSGSASFWIISPAVPAGLGSGVASIAGGYGHTCALMTTGGVRCWGYNNNGQLGDGTTATRMTPVAVSGLSSGVAAIAVGGFHTCALLTTGSVQCWGFNASGQLGTGSMSGPEACPTSCSKTPVPVSGVSNAIAIAAGETHTCALLAAGGVQCWGENARGQLGDGTNSARPTPADVSGLPGPADAIALGGQHGCALIAGDAWCWGRNDAGQLGDGTTGDSNVPVAVADLGASVSSLAPGYRHTCAVLTGGALRCWGSNDYGQLGDGSTAGSSVPVGVLGLMAQPALDSDGDGCTDKMETTTSPESELFGGRRNPASFWDFFDTPDAANARDGVIGLFDDIIPVAERFGASDDGGAAAVNRNSDPLSAPPAAPAYHPAFDRSAPPVDGDPWDTGPPDGTIDLFTDIFGVANQFGHACAP